jgi:hypothetical protein
VKLVAEKIREDNGRVGPGHPPVEYRFKKGNQASKGVRAGKGGKIAAAVRKILAGTMADDPEGRKTLEVYAASLVKNAIDGNGTAIREVNARIDGPVPTVHEGGDPDKPVNVRIIIGDDPTGHDRTEDQSDAV